MKIKAKEGNIFAVPLIEAGYGIGLVARIEKTIMLGYFFKRSLSTVSDELNVSDIKNWDIVLIARFSYLGIQNGNWPLIGTISEYNRNEWPIPIFRMQEPLSEKYFAVVYNEDLLKEERYLISEEEAEKLFGYGLYGYIALEKKLSAILT